MISHRQTARWALAFASACLLASPGYAQTVITRTAGFGGAGTITTTGTTTTIPANAGVQNGANLFHSFSQFDVAAGDMATFTGAGKTGAVNNVIARIFSASPSQINGGITVDAATLAGANLFLINPKGIIFGANSSVNVPGDFVTSTADYITLSDNVNTGLFYSDPTATGNTALTTGIMAAPVSAFGFLKAQSLTAGITVNGGANLAVGGSLQFVTGNFTATSGSTLSVTKASTPLGIFAGSQTSAAADGLVPYLTGTVTNYSSEANFTQHGAVHLGDSTGGASVTSTGTGGSVVIRGGQLVQAGGATSITKAAKAVSIKADSFALSGKVQTTSANGTIGIDTSDSTGTVTLAGGTITSAGGAITMGASALGGLSLDGTSTISETAGGGSLSLTSTGTITNAGTISATGNSTLAISTLGLVVNGGTLSSGTGAIGIDATGTTSLTGGSITSAGGAITLGGTSLVDLTLDALSSITETAGTGKTLSIASTGTVTNGGTISTSGANPLAISAHKLGVAGTISTTTAALTVNTTGSTTLTGGTITSAGAITLGNTALGGLSLDTGSSINSTGSTVNVTTSGDLAMTGGMIETSSTGATRAGDVRVSVPAGNITLSGGAEIASISSGSGGSGNVLVNPGVSAQNAAKMLSITGTGVAAFSSGALSGQAAFDTGSGIEAPNTGIFSIANGTGSAGSVNVIAIGNVAISAGGQIAAIQANAAGGNTGSINLTMNPDSFFTVGLNSLTIGGVTAAVGANPVTVPIIFTSTANKASSAGAVTINALSTSIELQPGAAIQTSTQDGQAGDVTIFGGSVTLDPYSDIQSLMSQTSASDTATTGRTGNVLVEVFNLDLNTFSFVGPLSIADNAFIQTVANPKAKGFDPVGNVQVYAGSLNEGGMNVVTQTNGYDYAYKIKGHTQILAVNNATLNGANGSDISSGNKVRVQNLIGFPNNTATPNPAPAAGNGIVLDGTLNGSRTGTDLPIAAVADSSGTSYTYTITTSDGTQAGSNLFLSFAQFDLGFNSTGPVNETAVFDAPGIANILARVTSGTASKIDGTLREAVGTNANLFLLNPAGMLFTANSSLNLNGALTLSTANSIGLTGGGVFLTTNNLGADNALTAGNLAYAGTVNLFDFSAVAPKGVTLDAATLSNAASGGQIEIISGDITLKNNALLNASQTLLFATNSAGLLKFDSGNSLATFPTPLISASTVLHEIGFGSLGTVALTGGSVLTVPTPNIASTILIRGKAFNLTDSLIVDQTTAEDGSVAGEVLIDVTGTVSILTSASSNNPAFISTSALGNEAGGSVYINASSLSITGAVGDTATTGILSTAQPSSYYTSDAGYVPFSYPGTDAVSGNAGSVTLNIGGAITLSTFGQVSTNTTGNGNAGTITITGPAGKMPQVTVSGGASISSSTNVDPQNHGAFTRTGNAGTIDLTASALKVTGTQSQIVSSAGTSIFTGPTGRGGNINITVDGSTGLGAGSTGDIAVSNNGVISASSFNTSLAGRVALFQLNSADLADPATNPSTVGGLDVASGGSITTADNGPGTTVQNSLAGVLQINVQAVTVDGGSITSSTLGASNAGAIAINGVAGARTDFVLVENGGVIASNTGGANGSGAGGTISINAGALNVTGANSAISTSSTDSSTGSGGGIGLNVRGDATAPGSTGDVRVTSGGTISASSATVGQAGSILITQANSLDLADPATNPATIGGVYLNNGTISTAATGAGTTSQQPNPNPGTITIHTQALTVTGTNGAVNSNTLGLSKAGDITIDGLAGGNAQFVIVTGSGSINSGTGGTGAGGAILIDTGALTVTGSALIATDSVFNSGNGGNITLNVTGNANVAGATGDVKVLNGGTIAAFSLGGTGNAGTVTITQKNSLDLADLATSPTVVGGLVVDGGSITTIADGTGTVSPPGSTVGDITLNNQALTMDHGGSIDSATFGLSRAGSITVNGPTLGTNTQWVMVTGGATIDSDTGGTGAGGAVTINSGALTLDGTQPAGFGAAAITTRSNGSSGNGGSITLNVTGNAAVAGATGDVAIIHGGTISASSGLTGGAGTVTITQVGSRDIIYPALTGTANGGLLLNNGIISTAANGPGNASSSNLQAGDITLKTEALTMTGGSVILSSTAGASKAGDVKVSGPIAGSNPQFVVMQGGAKVASETSGSGNGGTITMGTGSLLVDNSALSTSATGGTGNGGDITITAVAPAPATVSFVTLQHGGTITSSSVSSGAAGMITIAADRVTVAGAGAAISTNAGALGNALNTRGEINLAGQDLFIDNSGLVSATTGGFSPGGTITVKESNLVQLTTNARMDASSTAGTGGGNGGSILLGSNPDGPLNDIGYNSPFTVNLADNSVISCDSSNTNGGNIGIQTATLLMDHSLISTSEPNGPTSTLGGNISVRVAQLFYINNFSFINSNAGQGTGGNISIDPQFTILNHSGINAIGGSANGNVFIASDFVLSATSSILATGVVDINSLPLDLTGSLLPLPANLTDEQKRLREKCARAVNHEFSSFIVVGRGGTESAPEEFQPDFGLDSLPTKSSLSAAQ